MHTVRHSRFGRRISKTSPRHVSKVCSICGTTCRTTSNLLELAKPGGDSDRLSDDACRSVPTTSLVGHESSACGGVVELLVHIIGDSLSAGIASEQERLWPNLLVGEWHMPVRNCWQLPLDLFAICEHTGKVPLEKRRRRTT
jgi:hypothetical protein